MEFVSFIIVKIDYWLENVAAKEFIRATTVKKRISIMNFVGVRTLVGLTEPATQF